MPEITAQHPCGSDSVTYKVNQLWKTPSLEENPTLTSYVPALREFPDAALNFPNEMVACWAKQGDQIAGYLLGRRLLKSSKPEDRKEAVRLLTVASEPEAMASRCKIPVEKSATCRSSYSQKKFECECGLPEAQLSLAGVKIDEGDANAAIDLLQRAAMAGEFRATNMLRCRLELKRSLTDCEKSYGDN